MSFLFFSFFLFLLITEVTAGADIRAIFESKDEEAMKEFLTACIPQVRWFVRCAHGSGYKIEAKAGEGPVPDAVVAQRLDVYFEVRRVGPEELDKIHSRTADIAESRKRFKNGVDCLTSLLQQGRIARQVHVDRSVGLLSRDLERVEVHAKLSTADQVKRDADDFDEDEDK